MYILKTVYDIKSRYTYMNFHIYNVEMYIYVENIIYRERTFYYLVGIIKKACYFLLS